MRKDAPFDKKVYAKAKKKAALRSIILEPYRQLGGTYPEIWWLGTPVGFKNVWADGKTPNACVKAVREALTAALAHEMERK